MTQTAPPTMANATPSSPTRALTSPVERVANDEGEFEAPPPPPPPLPVADGPLAPLPLADLLPDALDELGV